MSKKTLSPSRDIERLNILLLIASLATVCLWWVGFRAREKGWHRHFQANTHTKGHVLSVIFLGTAVLNRHDYTFTLSEMTNAHKPCWYLSPP